MHEEDEKETLSFEDIDILESIGSDICEREWAEAETGEITFFPVKRRLMRTSKTGIRDLIYNIKTIKNDVDLIKKKLNN